ncbi:MAG: PEGA domain-containing protein [Polyangiaceae bacterium]|nr:PEGA domain-containing protein [Polyangiaceae bacterium]
MGNGRHWGRSFLTIAAGAAISLATPALFAQPARGPDPNTTSSVASPDSADDTRRAEAAARKKAGDEAMDAFRFTDALAAYSDAYAITGDPALLYNMGRALQALNRFPEALDKLEAFDAAAPAELKARVPRLPALIAELRQRISTVTISTNIEGARVLVRNTAVGKAPLQKPVRLTAGTAEIEIDAEGYFPAKKIVELPGGSAISVHLDLFSKATTGVLAVKTSAKGAEVIIDGKRIGIAPLELNLAKGSHRVVIKHPEYRVYETSAVVEAGRTKIVNATLETPSIVTRWWFWTTVGVVAATGAAVAIIAVSPRPADTGTIAPGQIEIPSPPAGGPMVISF